MKKTLSRIYSMMLVVCMILSMLSFSVSAEEVTAEIILETTGAAPAEGATVLLEETLMISMTGATPTGYEWYSKHRSGGTDYSLGDGATFVPPASLTEQYAADSVYCVVSYDGGSVTTEAVSIEQHSHSIPYGWDYKNGSNHYKGISNPENSDSAYTFYVDGKGFVIAKEQNVNGAAYFIVALDAYGDIFTGDNADTKSATEWKNIYGQTGFGNADGETMVTKLLGDGNTYESLVADSTSTYALPDAFDDYIDEDHSWAYVADKNGSLRYYNAAVALPTYSDYVNYAERVGHIDNLRAEAGVQPVLLRDLYGTAGVSVGTNVIGKVISNGLSTSNASGPYLVRPVFWLTKDFFEKNAIDPATAGSGVISIMTDETYTNQDAIKATYLAAGMEAEYNEYLAPKTAEIILETTNAAPAEGVAVPIEETLMISTNVTPTSYTWYSKGETTDYNIGSGESFVPPANLYERYNKATGVYCVVTYSGGSLTTDVVTMEEYVHNIPYGYDYKDGNNHYKGVPNAENSDPAYTFYIDGKGFVLAKEQNVKDAAYFVMALDAYGDIFTGDNAETKSATEWKNIYGQTGYGDTDGTTMVTKLLGDGNTFESLVADSTATYALPDAFDDYIDADHSWGYGSDKWGTVAAMTSSVNIPSYSDYVNYADRIGWKDNLQAEAGAKPVLLRDLYGTTSPTVIGKVISGNLSTSNASGPYLVRPVFWLAKNFFEKNVIDLSKTGSGVINILKNDVYTDADTLRATYAAAGKEAELDAYVYPPEATAEIILETTGAAPAEGATVPLEETLMINMVGATPTGYEWYSKHRNGTTTHKLGTEATFVPPASLTEQYGADEVYCVVSYAGGSITTEPVSIEKYIHSIPYGWDNKDGNNHYKGVPNAENSDPSYTFYIDGKGFVLAKEQNVNGAAYFIVALDAYGDIFTGDNTDTKSATEWKNIYGATNYGNADGTTMVTKLLSDGNTFDSLADDGDATYALPDVFDNYIDADHSWVYGTDKWGSLKYYNAAVALPAYSDYVNYAERIGWKDNLQAEAGAKPVLLRDLYGTTSPTVIGKVISENLSTSNESGPYIVRPVFWLAKNFFEKNVIDLTTAGSGVISIMTDETYTDQEAIKATYIAAGREADYNAYLNPDVSIGYTVRKTGEAGETAKILDTLVFAVNGVSGEFEYSWQIKAESEWTAAPTANVNGDEIALTTDLAGKVIRGVAKQGDNTYYGAEFTVPALTVTDVPGNADASIKLANPKNSAEANKFEVDGKGFVLLEEFDNDVQKYFVTTTDSYGTANFTDSNGRMAYKSYTAYGQYSNEENNLGANLMGEGNDYYGLVEDPAKTAIPAGIINNIYENALWGRYVNSDWSGTPYWVGKTTSAPIQMLSYSDFLKYPTILGWKDNVFVMDGTNYIIRDACAAKGAWSTNCVISNEGKSTEVTGAISLVRPAFYLETDFFKNVAINLDTAGSVVLATMKDKYYAEDLMHLYPISKLEEMGFTRRMFMKATWTDKNGGAVEMDTATSLKANVTVTNTNDKEQKAVLILAVYNKDNKLVKMDIKTGITISASDDTEISCTVDGITAASGNRARVMLWDSLDEMTPLVEAETK